MRPTARCGFCGLIWRRARRQHRALPESPTSNVDYYPETGRTAVITNWPAWWAGIQQIGNAARRDLYVWLAFSGCRAGESLRMETKHVDLENGSGEVSDHQDHSLQLPISDVHDRDVAQPDRRERRRIW